MKYLLMGAIALSVLLSCNGEEQEVTNENIESLRVSGLRRITGPEAKAMIEHVRSKEAIHRNASTEFNFTDFQAFARLSGDINVKVLRGNYLRDNNDESLRNQPAMIIAVTVDGKSHFYLSNTVCPPPDASTCIDGLTFD